MKRVIAMILMAVMLVSIGMTATAAKSRQDPEIIVPPHDPEQDIVVPPGPHKIVVPGTEPGKYYPVYFLPQQYYRDPVWTVVWVKVEEDGSITVNFPEPGKIFVDLTAYKIEIEGVSPKTGEGMPILPISIAGISGVGLLGCLVIEKKRRHA